MNGVTHRCIAVEAGRVNGGLLALITGDHFDQDLNVTLYLFPQILKIFCVKMLLFEINFSLSGS